MKEKTKPVVVEEKEKPKNKKKGRPSVFDLAKYLGANDAIFLYALMELKDRHTSTPVGLRKHDELDRPWFPCSLADVQNLILFDTQKQKRYFNVYRGMGVVSFQMAGFPSRRYIKINFAKLKECISSIKKGTNVKEQDNVEEESDETESD